MTSTGNIDSVLSFSLKVGGDYKRSGYVRYVPVSSADVQHVLHSGQFSDEYGDEDGGDEDENEDGDLMYSGDLMMYSGDLNSGNICYSPVTCK